ncbi:hypothetical protein [Snodgrassella alvi]|uniref:Uncharacterized protein n=1 Tax=Snodgrassella alvi TaxID=1196083 RepID=A0A855FP01_9NEIS|nr:hypothetical protein [Snodgrassella alvi]PIT62132.1 hypothetical protein BHC57_01505 [Snodgrassella alvi]
MEVINFTPIIGIIFITLISFLWLISIMALILGIWPRFSKKLIDYKSGVDEDVKKDRNDLFIICRNKIFFVRLSLITILIWSTLLVLTAIGLIKNI